MQTMSIVGGILIAAALLAGCKSEKQKAMDAWADKVCACKDAECAKTESMKREPWIDRAGWEEADSKARDGVFERAKACAEKAGAPW